MKREGERETFRVGKAEGAMIGRQVEEIPSKKWLSGI
jgi:hypothetical protein